MADPPSARADGGEERFHAMVISPKLFATVSGVIFLAELPDKTALAALLFAMRHRPLLIFLGASLALSLQSVIAVAASSLLAGLPPYGVHLGSGLFFVGCAVLMWRRQRADRVKKTPQTDMATGFWSALATVFIAVFVAERGDLTQIGTAWLAARYHAWFTILVASSLALWSVAASAVFVGNRTGSLLDPKLTQRAAAMLFVILGVLLAAGVL